MRSTEIHDQVPRTLFKKKVTLYKASTKTLFLLFLRGEVSPPSFVDEDADRKPLVAELPNDGVMVLLEVHHLFHNIINSNSINSTPFVTFKARTRAIVQE